VISVHENASAPTITRRPRVRRPITDWIARYLPVTNVGTGSKLHIGDHRQMLAVVPGSQRQIFRVLHATRLTSNVACMPFLFIVS